MNEIDQNPAEQITKKEKRELKRQIKESLETTKSRNTKVKRVALWGGIVVLVGGAIFGLVKLVVSSGPILSNQTVSLVNPSSGNDWIFGNSAAKVTLVEYGDFQCPACGAYAPIVKQLTKDYEQKIKFVFRNFPLYQIHPNAEPAARAAEAAGRQGKYWDMLDLIYGNQSKWAETGNAAETFASYAKSLNLDMNKYSSDLNSDAVSKKITDDYQSGISSGVNGTPTFFLNGKTIQNPRSLEEFKSIIDEALRANP